jgi:pSer/pThr/pTyr-binding forkhead associated (FHA) protein
MENDLVLDHVTISRRHAELFVDDEQNVFLTDLNSMYGTFVNGEKINNPVILSRNDEVYLGDKQYLDWEWEVFRERKKEYKDVVTTPWLRSNLDLMIIFGLILIVLFVLMVKI